MFLTALLSKAGEKSATTVRIFEKNDFYYFFEKDAEFAAQFTYGSSMVRERTRMLWVVMLCFSR